jgi:hypothetical protein
MEQPTQQEIILVRSDSGSASPKVSSEYSDSEIQLPDPEESNVVITGGDVSLAYDGPTWQPGRPIVFSNVDPTFQDWATPADQHIFGIDEKRAMP